MENMNHNRFSARRLAMNAVFIALYVVLGSFSINVGNFIRLTFVGFPRLISALLFGTMDGVLVGGIGEFLFQLMRYGLEATTVLWMLPPMTHALVAGLCARRFKGELNMKRTGVIVLVAGLTTSVVTTVVMYLDGMIKGYNPGLTTVSVLLRFVNTLVMCVIYTLIVPRTLQLLRTVYKPQVKG